MTSEVVERLIEWLQKRGEPDSGIDFEANDWRGRDRCTVFGEDARFVLDHFHGDGATQLATLISSLVAENERLIRDNIVASAECDEECDDPDCPYQHRPLTLRQAYENAVSRLRDAEDGSRRHHRAMAAADEARLTAERLLAEAVEQAFRDGLAYGGNVENADPDVAWQHSKARATLSTGGVNG